MAASANATGTTTTAATAGPGGSGATPGARGSTPRPEGASARGSAWGRPAVRYGFLGGVCAATFAADQLSKALLKASLQPGDIVPVVSPVLDLHYITNRGVAFGLFSRFGDIFVPVAILIMAVIFGYYRALRRRRLWVRTALGMQLGGALGNLLDRLRYGSVVDFVEVHVDAVHFHWPVFNLADSAIVVGVGILLACLVVQQDG